MKLFFRNPLFLAGLILRLVLIFVITAKPVMEWYIPFLEHSVALSLDPWGSWLENGGSPLAFPYGYVMWLVFLPLTIIGKLIGLPLELSYVTTLLLADFAMYSLLRRMHPGYAHLITIAYWLSPIVILASYVLGHNDLIPVAFMTLSYFLIHELRFKMAGLSIALAISAKLSMILVLPFFLIYFIHNRSIRRFLGEFLTGLGAGSFIFLFPFILSKSALIMLFSNPELSKIYELRLVLGEDLSIYLVPLAYILVLYAAWRVKRLNYNLFYALSGLALLLIVLLTPASPGWFIWTLPLLVAYQLMSDSVSIALVGSFSFLYVLSCLALLNLPNYLRLVFNIGLSVVPHIYISLIHTLMVVVGLIVATRLLRESVFRNDYFRMSRKPFVLGVAGDSGAGKDTFASAVEGLFGKHSVTRISGDDYHLWDRHKPMWQIMTHLNPMANNLAAFTRDIVTLVDKKPIHARHYDHLTGKMSHLHKIRSNDLIIASGLHTFYLPILREIYDLSVYLDIDEGLRKHFKMTRDVCERGHSLQDAEVSLQRREADSIKFVRPQASSADLVLSLKPIHPRLLEGDDVSSKLRYKLTARSRNGFNELALRRTLVGVCGLHVDMICYEDVLDVDLTIEGETTSEDIALAAKLLCPRIFEFLDIYPQWQDGVTGLMQLITITHIDQALTRRFL